ncbi:hypothetical protein Tco_1289645, partial [Tanacetum coccineum]
VQDQNVQEEVKESGLESIEDVTFDQIMDEIDQKNKDAEKAKSSYDTESKIKIIKFIQATVVSSSLLIHQGSQRSTLNDLDVINITPKDDEEGDAFDSRLWSMRDDDLASLTGFQTPDSANDDSKEGTGKTFYASADMPAQSDPLGLLHEELRILNTKIDKLESSIIKKVTDDVQSSMPSILIKDSIKQAVSKYIKEKLPVCAAQSRRFVLLQKELSKVIRTKMGKSVKAKVHKGMSFVSDQQASATSSIFSPTPPRESTPLRDESKGKGIATKEPLKDLMPYIKEGGSVPKMPKLKSFITSDGQLTPEDIIAQVKEMKRLADLKAENEKLEESLKRIMNPVNIKAQAQKIGEYEVKRTKILNEYNDCINQRADELSITKISYRVNSYKEATIRITRANDPLNVTMHERFRLKTLGISEWLEVHSLASKTKSKSNDLLLQSLKEKF